MLHYYGENSGADRQRIAEHLSACDRCRVFVDDLQRLLPQMAKSEEMPSHFGTATIRETVAKLAEQEERKFWWRSWFAPARGWMVPAFGTVGVVVLVVGLLFGKGNLGSFMERSPVKIPQEILVDSNQLEFFKSMDILESLDHLEQQDGTKGQLNSTQTDRVRYSRGVA